MVGDVGQFDIVEHLGCLASFTESSPAQDRHVLLTKVAAVVKLLELVRLRHPRNDLATAVQLEGVLQLDYS